MLTMLNSSTLRPIVSEPVKDTSLTFKTTQSDHLDEWMISVCQRKFLGRRSTKAERGAALG